MRLIVAVQQRLLDKAVDLAQGMQQKIGTDWK